MTANPTTPARLRLHPLLEEQLRAAFGAGDDVPAAVAPLLERVNDAYRQAEEERARLTRSLNMMASELEWRSRSLRRQLDEQGEMRRDLTELEARFPAFMKHFRATRRSGARSVGSSA
jgi:hypothetical protein